MNDYSLYKVRHTQRAPIIIIIIKTPKTEMADSREKKRREEKRHTESHFVRFSKSASLFIEFPFLMFIRFFSSPILYTKMQSRVHRPHYIKTQSRKYKTHSTDINNNNHANNQTTLDSLSSMNIVYHLIIQFWIFIEMLKKLCHIEPMLTFQNFFLFRSGSPFHFSVSFVERCRCCCVCLHLQIQQLKETNLLTVRNEFGTEWKESKRLIIICIRDFSQRDYHTSGLRFEFDDTL